MKLFKLYTHQKSFSADDLILNPKEHPDAKLHDVVEIYHPEDEEAGRLLLQITGFNEELKGREIISVESNIAAAFNLRTYADVIMRVVDPAAVALDSVEITFKDQYMGRSEMWRLKKFLTNTCVYVNKKIEYCSASLRCQVYEMWSQGDRVACGVITDDTKVVFRSSTSMVYLFIQMSSEMWDFDIHGDLYFEKAVNGFLTDLFGKWKRMGSNHEVTIVLFSRTFYAARTLDEFPAYMRDCLQQDYRGRFYEDFYRVAIQNERNDDWTTMLVQLRRLFTSYPATVLRYHERGGTGTGNSVQKLPVATNSTAAQGNFLEVLNISLNVFEKHYLDRSFDRTGQLSVVITPGVGVFEVDRELTNITKQRIIDNGVGSDLVCVGEQPLHAVPLLKFHNKDASPNAVDDYSMPHWINLSFYSTNKKVAYSTFIPRIKLPPLLPNSSTSSSTGGVNFASADGQTDDTATSSTTTTATIAHNLSHLNGNSPPSEYIHNSLFDYDAYDAQIFTIQHALQHAPRVKKTSVPSLVEGFGTSAEWEALQRGGAGATMPTLITGAVNSTAAAAAMVSTTLLTSATAAGSLRRKMSDPDIHHGHYGMSPGNHGYHHHHHQHHAHHGISESMTHLDTRSAGASIVHGSTHGATIVRPGRALINPFAPSHVTIKLTSNRRRWTHIFPKGPSGVLIQQHHYQAMPATQQQHASAGGIGGVTASIGSNLNCSISAGPSSVATVDESGSLVYGSESYTAAASTASAPMTRKILPLLHSAAGPLVTLEPAKSLTLLWGATGEQEWTPALTTGVDWKSLTIPACLPITTDYFPDKRSLHNDYLVSDYTLLPEGVNIDYAQNRAIYRRPLTTEEVFAELISQRLAQGFQLIVLPEKPVPSPAHTPLLSLQTPATPGQTAATLSAALHNSSSSGGGGNAKHGFALSTSPSLLRATPMVTSPLLLPLQAGNKEPTREYLLSIGRIFHKISLNDSEITVTRFRPRHPYPPINIDYRYRFKAPQHDTYEVSGVHFTTEKLENFNWNYMDQYICTRGDTDYPLLENLKYWRFRMYMLPKEHAATKRIIEMSADHGTTEHCDIYQDGVGGCVDAMSRQYAEDFVRFMEIHMNKIKKMNCHKLARGSPTTQQSHLTRRRHSTSFITRPPAQSHASSSSLARNNERSPVVSNGRSPVRSGSKVEKGQFRVSPGTNSGVSSNEAPGVPSSNGPDSNLLMTTEDNEEAFLADTKLSSSATLSDIFDAMRHPVSGVTLVARAQSLPSNTFVLWDAINWLQSHVEGAHANAVELLEAMRKADMICHASGDCSKPLRPGFFLYFICHPDSRTPDYTPPLGDLETFENEWMEVEIEMPPSTMPRSTTTTPTSMQATNATTSFAGADSASLAGTAISDTSSSSSTGATAVDPFEAAVPQFLRETVDVGLHDGPIYKQAHLEIDANQKSDRIEWGHVRYHRQMRAGHAFEFVPQWLTASGPIVYDLIYVWMRKAQQCGFQLVPIPADPLAEPFTDKSDPLRGPIFVPLNVHCLERHGASGDDEMAGGVPGRLFKEFRKESWPDRLLMLQEAIVQRFGFLGCYAETRTGSNQATLDRQYVHCSGNMFVLVASPHEELKMRKRLASGGNTMLKRPAFLSKPRPGTPVLSVSSPAGVKTTPGVVAGGVTSDTYVTRHVNVKNKDDFDVPRKIGFLWSWNHMIANKKWKSLVLTNSPDAELFQLRMLQDFKDFCANRNDRLVRFWENSWAAKENACAARNAS